jgi:outer membrane protein OmpA-like peptidoglycan-associated protein
MRTYVIGAVVVAAIGCGDVELPIAEPAEVVHEPAEPVKPEPVVAPQLPVAPAVPVKPPPRLEPETDHPGVSAIYTDLRFDRGKATLGEAWGDLSAIATAIKDGGYVLVEVHGHIARGEAASLAQARAEYVKKRLIKQGVPAALLCTVAHTRDPQMNLPELADALMYVDFVGQRTAKVCPPASE